jgi:hypothetical protein
MHMRRWALGGMLAMHLACGGQDARRAGSADGEAGASIDGGREDGPPAAPMDVASAVDLASAVEVTSGAPDTGPGLSADTNAPAPDAGPVWRPAPGTSWQWQLTKAVDLSVDVRMYDIDLFDASQATIDALHAKGRTVICYFSAGSHEDWRPDASLFPAAAIGAPLDGWPGEHWLDTRSEAVRGVMKQRLDAAAAKKCDGVEPDNVDGYGNGPGFPLTAATQLDYNRFLAGEAHARALSVGLKNDVEQVNQLQPEFDWALNESCLQYDECDTLAPFIRAGKAVFHVEYGDAALADTVCPRNPPGFSTLIKKMDLDAWRVACP